MSVLIGVGGEPTLCQHYYNSAYFQAPGRYICVIQKQHFGDVSFNF